MRVESAARAEAIAHAINDAGVLLRAALDDQDQRTPHEAALAAWRPGGPSVDELEAVFRADRGLPPIKQTGAA